MSNSFKYITAHFLDGRTIETAINGTIDSIESYYLNQWFNLADGTGPDDMQQCISVHFED